MYNKIGIDNISFYIPKFFLQTKNLNSSLQPNSSFDDLLSKTGQIANAVIDRDEDIITMGVLASLNILKDYSKDDRDKIDYLIFATESSFDLSKSAGLFCKDELNLGDHCNFFEIKQACYSGTAALIFALNYVNLNPDRKVLIITSDISKYETLNAKITQGAAACAFIVSKNPKIIEFRNDFISFSKNVSDFYKPIASEYPIFNGALSLEVYCNFFYETFKQFAFDTFKKKIDDNNVQSEENFILVPHLPFVTVFNFIEKTTKKIEKEIFQNLNLKSYFEKIKCNFIYQNAIKYYTSLIGNSYGACMYINLCSLIDNIETDLSGREIYMFAFGSGATASSFVGKIVHGYKKFLKKDIHQSLFDRRIEIK